MGMNHPLGPDCRWRDSTARTYRQKDHWRSDCHDWPQVGTWSWCLGTNEANRLTFCLISCFYSNCGHVLFNSADVIAIKPFVVWVNEIIVMIWVSQVGPTGRSSPTSKTFYVTAFEVKPRFTQTCQQNL